MQALAKHLVGFICEIIVLYYIYIYIYTTLPKVLDLTTLVISMSTNLNVLNEAKTHHQTPMTCTFIIWTKVLAPLL